MRVKTKLLLLVLFIGTLFPACNLFNSDEEDGYTHRFPMNDVFTISGMIEYTDGQPKHYTQIFLSEVSNSETDNIPDPLVVPGIFFPDVGRQATFLMSTFQWEPTPVEEANVEITGPLNNSSLNTTVQLTYEQNGVYGDINYDIPIRVDGVYALEIKRQDGTMYRDTTTVPPPVNYNAPDTVHIDMTTLKEQGEGIWYEEGWTSDTSKFEITGDINNHLVTRNRISLSSLLADGYHLEDYTYHKQGPYFISYWSYAEYMSGYYERNIPVLLNINDISDSSSIMEDIEWIRVCQYDKNLSANHLPTYNNVGSYSDLFIGGDDPKNFDSTEPNQKHISKVLSLMDPSYLFEMTTITKFDQNGNKVPKQESKTIGVFGSRATVYDKAILIPKRDYDPEDYGWSGAWYWYDHYEE
jgi:hypothetical protein